MKLASSSRPLLFRRPIRGRRRRRNSRHYLPLFPANLAERFGEIRRDGEIGADKVADSPQAAKLRSLADIIRRARSYTNDRFKPATARGLMPRRLAMKLSRMEKRPFDELIGTLLETGDILEGQATKEVHGFSGLVYWPAPPYPPSTPWIPPGVGAREAQQIQGL
jgi:hypothetical protein